MADFASKMVTSGWAVITNNGNQTTDLIDKVTLDTCHALSSGGPPLIGWGDQLVHTRRDLVGQSLYRRCGHSVHVNDTDRRLAM